MTASRLADRTAEFWDDVKFDYESSELHIQQVLAKHDLTRGELNYARLRFDWKRRRVPQVNRKQIIKRLFDLMDRMLKELEGQMTTIGEKEVTILGRLVHSMGKLIDIEAATNTKATPRQTKDMHDIRRKLVERIEDLKRN